jgi:hypothetical protein
VAGRFANVHQTGTGRGIVQQTRIHQAIIQDHLRLHETAQSLYRQQLRVTWSGPNQIDLAGFPYGYGTLHQSVLL